MNESSTLKDAVHPDSLRRLKEALKQENASAPKKSLAELEAARKQTKSNQKAT